MFGLLSFNEEFPEKYYEEALIFDPQLNNALRRWNSGVGGFWHKLIVDSKFNKLFGKNYVNFTIEVSVRVWRI